MPHIYIWEPDGIYRKFSGLLNGEEILESNFELQIHPEFKTASYIINDFSEVSSLNIQASHIEAYAKTDDIFSNTKGKLKIALVISTDEQRTLARHYCELMQGKLYECKIFQLLPDARAWLTQ